MAIKFNRSQTFATNGTVTAAALHNLIDGTDIYQALITDQTDLAAVATDDKLLIADASLTAGDAPRSTTVQNLFDDALTGGTYTNANISGIITFGTATGNRTISTSATITTGTIPNLTSSTASITLGTIPTLTAGTTTSTAANITNGTVQTLTASTANISQGSASLTQGTIATLNSTTGTIATLNSTTGTIATLNSTTPTFLGAITASTNTINVGSGQIYKDASGNVGIGITNPSVNLEVVGTSGMRTRYDASGFGLLINQISSAGDAYVINQANAGIVLATNNTERLRIDSSGNVGIGTASPRGKLDVSGDVYVAAGKQIQITGSPGTTGLQLFGQDAAESLIGTMSSQSLVLRTNATERLRIDASGGVTIAGLAGTGSRAVNASAAGLLSAASDASLKEEVVGAHIAGLNEILQIHPKMYRWKDDIANRGENASVELGFIANDVAPIIPSAAPLGNNGLYGFYDRSITAALVKAVQELKSENNSLKSRIEALEAK